MSLVTTDGVHRDFASFCNPHRVGGSGQLRLRRNGQRRIAVAACLENLRRRAIGGDRQSWNRARHLEPRVLRLVLSLELRVDRRAGAHQARRDGRDADAVRIELGANGVGQPRQRKLAR